MRGLDRIIWTTESTYKEHCVATYVDELSGS